MGFSLLGVLIAGVFMMPSIFFITKFKPKNKPEELKEPARLLVLMERMGQVGCVFFLIFSNSYFESAKFNIFFGCMFLLIGLYYILWCYYLLRDCEYLVLIKPILFVPIPGALLFVFAIASCSFWIGNAYLGVFAAIFGMGHVGIHWDEYKQLKEDL